MDAGYNDIARWQYADIPRVFGATEKQARSFVIKTKDELERLLKDPSFCDGKGVQLVELWMPREDAPRALKITTEVAARTNALVEE